MKGLKKGILLLALEIMLIANAVACPVCEKEQPEVLQGIAHGTGPQAQWDVWIVWIGSGIVGLTLLLSLKYLIFPGEKKPGHIKYQILNES